MLLGKPNVSDRGEHILNCLQSMGPILQEELVELWDAVIPKLLNYLNGKYVRYTVMVHGYIRYSHLHVCMYNYVCVCTHFYW